MARYVVQECGFSDAGPLIQFARVIPQGLVIYDTRMIAFEMGVINGIESEKCR